MESKNDILTMKAYLRHAIEFEKCVYIWSRALDEANARLQQVYRERNRLEAAQVAIDTQHEKLEKPVKVSADDLKGKLKKYRKMQRLALCAPIIVAAIIFAVSFLRLEADMGKRILYAAIWTVAKSFVVLLICFVVFLYYAVRVRNIKQELREQEDKSSARWTEIIRQGKMEDLRREMDETRNDLAVGIIEEAVVRERQEEISKQLRIARQNLRQIYAANMLPPKYHCWNAVATFYEYLDTGRCTTIRGHGGIYDTYETERILLEQLEQQMITNRRLERMEDNQRMICQELSRANSTLSSIHTEVRRTRAASEETARNTAISAMADQQTAAAASWMAWNAWAGR